MNFTRSKSQGKINLLIISGMAVITLAGAYFYLDYQADSLANESMISLVTEAESQGLVLRYSSVDASPLYQTIEVTDFAIIGNDQEPDIKLGNVVVKGFSWQDLNDNQNKLPLKMSINVENGELYLKNSMVESNAELQSLVRIFGNTIPFTAEAAYKRDPAKNLLELSFSQAVKDNFFSEGEMELGNIEWLTNLEQQQPTEMYSQLMSSTLNNFSLTYKNTGLVEKIRKEVSDQTGQTNEQLLEESLAQMKQLQMTLAEQWGPIFTPFIDQMIKFTGDPKQLQLDIHPKQPLSGQNILMAFLGGEMGFIKLIEEAQIKLKAN